MVLAGACFLVAYLDDALVAENARRGERFEAVVVFVFLPLVVMEAALGRVAAAEALDALGLLPERVVCHAAKSVAVEVDRNAESMDE